MFVSIVLCTRDRVVSLAKTLEALGRQQLEEGVDCEVLVVDNASSDDTAQLLRSWRPGRLQMKLLTEPQPGKSRACNRALQEARGEIILCVDDDVRPGARWLTAMCDPIVAGRADAVSGKVEPATEVRRPWMTDFHLGLMGCTPGGSIADRGLYGSSMAFSRRVLGRVSGFDPELGAGALGRFEDSLFSMQLVEAGFRLTTAGNESAAVHHFDAARLARCEFLKSANAWGRSKAYIAHHWQHETVGQPLYRLVRSTVGLWFFRGRNPTLRLAKEGITAEEFHQVQRLSFHRQLIKEIRRPRVYARHGLARCRLERAERSNA